jgi:hypothetical protein
MEKLPDGSLRYPELSMECPSPYCHPVLPEYVGTDAMGVCRVCKGYRRIPKQGAEMMVALLETLWSLDGRIISWRPDRLSVIFGGFFGKAVDTQGESDVALAMAIGQVGE